MRYPNHHEVLRLDRVCKATRNDHNIVTHTMRNRAGTIFSFTTRSYKVYDARNTMRVQTMFLIADQAPYGGKRNRHGSVTPDILPERVPYGMLHLPRLCPVWNEPRENFERGTLVNTIQRGLVIKNGNSTLEINPPPQQYADFIDVYTTFGVITFDEVSALMLKISAPPFGQILRSGL